ncbi:MAG TPA: metallophosphoesterase [Vulgatibacter sp.]|nr:metallophosphoesterase [Vulgatibacter sp.]
MGRDQEIRLAAVGDLHCRTGGHGHFRKLVDDTNAAEVDALVLCGDLTDHGQPDEAKALLDELSRVRAPIVGVLGNHDLEAGKGEEVCAILHEGGIHVLDGDHWEPKGRAVGFAGTKGFAGGFGRASLQGFGEEVIKALVYETVREALKLESALLRVDAPVKVAITHYAPVRDTCLGENPEIMPFLGSSRLADSIDLQGAAVILHGHAHYGSEEGRTLTGIPVYNVASPVLRKADPTRRMRIVALERAPAPAPAPESGQPAAE